MNLDFFSLIILLLRLLPLLADGSFNVNFTLYLYQQTEASNWKKNNNNNERRMNENFFFPHSFIFISFHFFGNDKKNGAELKIFVRIIIKEKEKNREYKSNEMEELDGR